MVGEAGIPFRASLWTLDESLLDDVLDFDLDLDLDDEVLGSDMMARNSVKKGGRWRKFCLYWCWRGNGYRCRQERLQRCDDLAGAADSRSKRTQSVVKMASGLFRLGSALQHMCGGREKCSWCPRTLHQWIR